MLPENSEVSIRKGTVFVLRDGDNAIHIIGSNLNGKEKVYFNEELVSEKRNLGLSSHHEFEDKDGNVFRIEIESINMSMASLECRVYKNDDQLKTFRTSLNSTSNSSIILWLTLMFTAGAFGVFMSLFNWPIYFIIFLVLLLVPIYLFLKYSKGIVVTEE